MIRFDRSAKYAFVAACVAMLIAGLGFRVAVNKLNIYLKKQPVYLREHFATIPRTLDEWRASGQDVQFDDTLIETLGTEWYLERSYRRNAEDRRSSSPMSVHLAYYTGMIDAIPHVPDRCMVAGGFEQVSPTRNFELDIDDASWIDDPDHVNRKTQQPYPMVTFPHRITGRPVTVHMPLGDFELRVTEFRHPDSGDHRVFAGFLFLANGQVTAMPLEVRSLAFDRTDEYAYYCKVQFTMMGDATFGREQFIASVSELFEQMLPEVMRCLPDWAEVEHHPEQAESIEQDGASERLS